MNCKQLFASAAFLAGVACADTADIAAPWRDYWRTRRAACDERIERIRKADASVVLRDREGKALADRPCQIRQLKNLTEQRSILLRETRVVTP